MLFSLMLWLACSTAAEEKKEKEKVYARRRVWEASDRPWRPFSENCRLPVLQGEIAALTAQQQQLTASESASRQQLAASVQAHEQATAACASAEAELHRLSAVLEDSDAQLVLAHQKEAQVSMSLHAFMGGSCCTWAFVIMLGLC